MPLQGYRPGGEPARWWKVAQHLDEAQLASVDAMASNLDDPTQIFALQETLRQAQAILLEIFRAKGLLPAPIEPPVVAVPAASPMSPTGMPMPPMGLSMPMPPMLSVSFDPFDPVSVRTSTDDVPLAGTDAVVTPVEEPPQDHVEASVAAPDAAVLEIPAQVVVMPEAEA